MKNSILEKIKAIYGQNCIYCQKDEARHLDFIIPQNNLKHYRRIHKSMGANYEIKNKDISNLLPVCDKCNNKKGNRSIYIFLNFNDLTRIDKYRKKQDFILLNSCKSQRELHRLILTTSKEIENASKNITT